jgi:hypothetical protein
MTNPMPPEPAHGAGPTEDDEEEVLRALGYVMDEHGIYRSPQDGDE